MADIVDIANDKIEEDLRVKLLNMANEKTLRQISVDCVDCGELIPPMRQQATGGTNLCIDCAEFVEFKNKLK